MVEIDEDEINPRPERIGIIVSERDIDVIRLALNTLIELSDINAVRKQEARGLMRRIEIQA